MTQRDRANRRRVQRLAETAVPLRPIAHGGPGRGHKTPQRPAKRQGNSSRYLTNRIARDRPDILERMKAGEFTSVKAAAREAGIQREGSTVNQILNLWRKATPEERRTILNRLQTLKEEH